MHKLIFVLVDALGLDTATKHFGFLEHMAEAGQAAKYRLIGQLPAISRPMYETLLTGVAVFRHGVTSNSTCRRSRFPNLFSMTKQAGMAIGRFRLTFSEIAIVSTVPVISCTASSTTKMNIPIPICLRMANFCGRLINRIF